MNRFGGFAHHERCNEAACRLLLCSGSPVMGSVHSCNVLRTSVIFLGEEIWESFDSEWLNCGERRI